MSARDHRSQGGRGQRVPERELERRRRVVRRQRLLAGGSVALVLLAVGLAVALASGGRRHSHSPTTSGSENPTTSTATAPKPKPTSFAVGVRTMRLVDSSRTVALPGGGTEPRTILTYVRYPALGPTGHTDLADAPAASAYGPYPLIVFGHGFAVTPTLYNRLLQSWARAGYVVAAPVFPLENADAPGGSNESDLVNQPADMRFVITQLLAASAGSGPLSGLIDSVHVAVAGQSDGGDTALALAYDSRFRDSRIGAAVILSGAEIPQMGSFTFPAEGPPLLATQGTADTINPLNDTLEFFAAAHRPKYLLELIGAEHLPPYSTQQPQLGVVERVSTDFLDYYLKHRAAAQRDLTAAGSVPGIASLQAEP